MDVLIQTAKSYTFNPVTDLVQSPCNILPFQTSLSIPGLVAAEFIGTSGNLTTPGNIEGYAVVSIVAGVVRYLPVKIQSVAIVDSTKVIPPQMHATPFSPPSYLPQLATAMVTTAEGYNSLAPSKFVDASGNVTNASVMTEQGKDFGTYIGIIAAPLQNLKTAQFRAGISGASTWLQYADETTPPVLTVCKNSSSVCYTISVDLPLDAAGVASPCYLVRGTQLIETVPALPTTPTAAYGAFTSYLPTGGAAYWRLDLPGITFSRNSVTTVGNYGASLAFGAASRSIIDYTQVVLNPNFPGPPFFPNLT